MYRCYSRFRYGLLKAIGVRALHSNSAQVWVVDLRKLFTIQAQFSIKHHSAFQFPPEIQK